MNTSAGTISAKPPAKRYASGESFKDARTCAGNVRLLTVRMTEANTSFHDSTKAKMLAAASPGNASGSAIRLNAPTGVQPSVSAASSRSPGTATNTLAVINTVVGKASAVCTRATAQSVSYRLQSINVIVSGTARSAIGNARVVRISTWNPLRARKTNRASA